MVGILHKTAKFDHNFIKYQYLSKIQKVDENLFISLHKNVMSEKFYNIKFLAEATLAVAINCKKNLFQKILRRF